MNALIAEKCKGATPVFGQTKCDVIGLMHWRDAADMKDAFPDHDNSFPVDQNWPWAASTTKCCVEEKFAQENGIYQSALPSLTEDTEDDKGAPTGIDRLQPQLCASYQLADAAQSADYIFTACFTFEMLVKIIAMGFFFSKGDPSKHMPGAYLRDAWNWLDFIVVISAWITMFGDGGGGLTVLRTFRVLRPLRAANKWPAMKMIVRSLLRSVPPMQVRFQLAKPRNTCVWLCCSSILA